MIRFNRFVFLAGLLFLGVVVMAGCGADSTSKAEFDISKRSPLEVITYVVQSESAGQGLSLSGLTEPVRRSSPAARMMARVLATGFQEGDRVAARQVLVRLDARDLEARRRQAQAALATAATTQDVARLNLERLRNLYKAGTVSRSQLEKVEIAYAQAEAAVAAAKSGRDELDVNLAYAEVRAPFDGVIVRKMIEEGSMVTPGQPLFILEDESRLRIVAAIGSDLAAGLKPGQTLSVLIGGEKTQGGIEGIVPSGQTLAPGLRVQLLIDNPSHRFKSGTLATVKIPTGPEDASEIFIPKAALFEHGRLTGAFVIGKDAAAHLHWLILGESQGDMVKVLSGLKAGDKVIFNPEKSGIADGLVVKEMTQ